MEFKLNNDLWRHNEVWQINRNHWLEIFRGGFWSHFFFQGGLCPPDFFSAYSTDQNEPLWRKKSAPLKKKKRPSEEKKAPPWKVSPLINLPLLLKNVTGTQCGSYVCSADNEDSKPNSSPLWMVTGARFPGISTALSPLHPISMPKPQNFYKWTCTASKNPTSTPKLQNFYKYICTASGKVYVCQHISAYQVCNLCELDDLM